MIEEQKNTSPPGSMDPESHPEPGTVESYYDSTWGEIVLWTGMLGAPTLWLIQFQFNYSLVPWSCRTNNLPILYSTSILFFLLALTCAGISFWNWRRIGLNWPKTEDEGIRARTRLMAVLGLLMGFLFAGIIGAQSMAYFFFSPCEI